MTSEDLAELLTASLRQWGLDGTAAAVPADDLAADIDLLNGRIATLRRDDTTGARLPVWRLTIGEGRPLETPSLRMMFGALRTELDEDYRPGRLIIGVQSAARLHGGVTA